MHALLSGVLEYAWPVTVAFVVVGICFGVRKPTFTAVILAKLLAIGLGAREVIASERISIRYHGEHSPRDMSLRIRGLAIVRVHDFATLVAGILVAAWAIWMCIVIRDLLRRPFPTFGSRDDFREQACAPSRHQRAVSEVNECVRIMALARNFDRLWCAVKVLRAQRERKRRKKREAEEAREHPPVGAADESSPSFQEKGGGGMQSASTSPLPRSALRSASASGRSTSSGRSSSKSVRIRDDIVDCRYYCYETADGPTCSAAIPFSDLAQDDLEGCADAVRAWSAAAFRGPTAGRLPELQGRPARP
jgi:hypothetical protein